MRNEDIEREYKNLLIGLSKYFIALKEYAEERRERGKEAKENGKIGEMNGLLTRAGLYEKQAKSILWIIHRQKAICEHFFATDSPDLIQYEDCEDSELEFIDKIPCDRLGVTPRLIDKLDKIRQEYNGN